MADKWHGSLLTTTNQSLTYVCGVVKYYLYATVIEGGTSDN